MSSPAFTVALGPDDWNDHVGGWTCSALSIPGVDVKGLFVSGARADPVSYDRDPDGPYLRWADRTDVPASAVLVLALEKALAPKEQVDESRELAARWKKLAILMPLLVAVSGALIPLLFDWGEPARDEDPSAVEVWTVRGSVHFEDGEGECDQVKFFVKPPHYKHFAQCRFKVDVLPRLEYSGSELPDLLVYHRDYRQQDIPLERLRVSASEERVISLDPILLHRQPAQAYDPAERELLPAMEDERETGDVR